MSRGSGSCTLDLRGQRFGRLQVVKWVGTDAQRGSIWQCLCDCGTEVNVRRRNLIVKGNTVSCGCHKKDVQRYRLRKHGNAGRADGSVKRTKEYACWQNIMQRCYNPKHQRYKSYGAKGVTVCEAWRSDFAAFLRDVGPAPFTKACIDRIDPFGNYEPSNVRWVDLPTSNANKRKSGGL